MIGKALQLLPLNREDPSVALSAAPNPKPSAADKRGYGSLASLYTSFSTDFARFALDLCLSEGHRRVVDPFGGMGTVGEAGRSLPIDILLNDLNPFASLSCVFRTSSTEEIGSAIRRISELSLAAQPVAEREAFLSAIQDRLGQKRTLLELVNDGRDPQAREVLLEIHLISLIRIASHRRLRGSNPTWTKRSTDQLIEPAAYANARHSVLSAAKAYSDKLVPRDSAFRASYRCDNVCDLRIGRGEMDAVVTSPPYPNRTDYIRHYLPASELLVGGNEDAERRLRETQIGTPLIRAATPDADLPQSALAVIERVRTHGSYASERYYAKGFLYYFADMLAMFVRMSAWLKYRGIAIVVVQDAYYKEMRIPVADLLIDIARTAGLELEARKDFPVRQTLSRLSAPARAATPIRISVESALSFRRVSK